MPDWMNDMEREARIMQEKQAERDRIQREADERDYAFREQQRLAAEAGQRDRDRERRLQAEREADARRRAQAAVASQSHNNARGRAAAAAVAAAATVAAPRPSAPSAPRSPAPSSGSGGSGLSLSGMLTAAAFFGIAAVIASGDNDDKPAPKTPAATAQPIKSNQTLEQSFATVSRIPPQNLRFIAAENTELSIPFIRDQKIYEYAVTVEKGSCLLKAANDYQTYTNAVLGIIADNSPIQTSTVMVMGLINPTHSLVQQDASDFSPEDCNVRLLSAPPSTMAFPTEPEIQAMIQLGMASDQYYTATEDLEIYRKNSTDSEMEYRFAKGSCLRVMGRTDTFQYVAAYSGNSLTGALIYDGYADPSKLQRKIFAKDSTELCHAALTSAPAQDTKPVIETQKAEKPAPPAAPAYKYFEAAKDIDVSLPYIRDGKLSEYGFRLKSGSCLPVKDELFSFENFAEFKLGDLTYTGFFNPHDVAAREAGSQPCNADLLQLTEPYTAAPTDDEFHAAIIAHDLDTDAPVFYARTTVEVFNHSSYRYGVKLRFAEGSCFPDILKLDGAANVHVIAGIKDEGFSLLSGFVDSAKLIQREKTPGEGCQAILAPAP